MVRMSDILKNLGDSGEEKEKPHKKKPSPQPQPEEREKIKATPEKEPAATQEKEGKKEEKQKISEAGFASVVMKESKAASKESKAASSEEAEKAYEETLSLAKEIIKDDIDYESIDIKKITARIEKLIDQLKLGNKEEMLNLALTKNPKDTNRNYLVYHSLNTCIFSIETGLVLGYEKSKLIELGISTLLHDIGMIKYLNIAGQQRKLTDSEYNEIKNHPIKGLESLEKIKGIFEKAIRVAEQHHERVDGSGYPRNLKSESIDEYAKILNVVDVFEAMTHPRAYRDEYIPLEALQEILAHKKTFEYKIIKILIENIGIFPVGSLVELNTKEIAEVVKVNPKTPLRPVVQIIANADGRKLQEARGLNLVTEPNISITRGIKKKDLHTK